MTKQDLTKEEMIEKVRAEKTSFPTYQQELIDQLIEKLADYDTLYDQPIYYVKKIKETEEGRQPLRLFTIGVKERPLSFVAFSLNLDTNEIIGMKSEIHEHVIEFQPTADPMGKVLNFKTYHGYRRFKHH